MKRRDLIKKLESAGYRIDRDKSPDIGKLTKIQQKQYLKRRG